MNEKHIYIINNDQAVARLLSGVLELKGFNTASHSDAHQAIKEIQQNKPELVITGLQMSHINGIELAHKLETLSPDTEVIIISPHITEATRSRAKERGVFAVMENPVHLPTLLEKIDSGMTSNRMNRRDEESCKEIAAKALAHDYHHHLHTTDLSFRTRLCAMLHFYYRKHRKQIQSAVLSVIFIALSVWVLVSYQNYQYKQQTASSEKGKLEKIIEIIERGEQYLQRDEMREKRALSTRFR